MVTIAYFSCFLVAACLSEDTGFGSVGAPQLKVKDEGGLFKAAVCPTSDVIALYYLSDAASMG